MGFLLLLLVFRSGGPEAPSRHGHHPRASKRVLRVVRRSGKSLIIIYASYLQQEGSRLSTHKALRRYVCTHVRGLVNQLTHCDYLLGVVVSSTIFPLNTNYYGRLVTAGVASNPRVILP
ncbi:hypothetical protein BZA05DRAFT_402459 [Tricharina praecox]|uniref:uncharacterized protein n=1 Tax=Tricharina praecox TaxID=43433 RepID=UPI002220C437|nr:uncharacterized protein BZA05DRAFT_402459 [Tricharina praecox]KAI5849183.1 hypothetical protein BZA05DRAFT_402459 [Tricharina praecox]